jgi:hypothetical protein
MTISFNEDKLLNNDKNKTTGKVYEIWKHDNHASNKLKLTLGHCCGYI